MSNDEPRTDSDLTGRSVELTQLVPESYRRLFDICSAPEVRDRWEPSAFGTSYEAWVARLWDSVFCQYAIQVHSSQWAVDGLVRCSRPNFRHQTGQVSVVIAPQYFKTGHGIEAIVLFIDHLFNRFAFRKLYAESLAYNYSLFESGAGRLFEVEGVLRDHETHRGALHDMYILGFERQNWARVGGELARKLRKRRP